MKNPRTAIAKIAVEHAVYRFDQAFDYCIPPDLQAQAQPGCRVLVPFGNANASRQGMILAVEEPKESTETRIKSITAVLDQAPLLSKEMLQLVPWIKERYFCTLFDGVKLVLPGGMYWKVKPEFSLAPGLSPDAWQGLEELEQQLCEFLSAQAAPVEKEKLCRRFALFSDGKRLEQLCKQGLLVKSNGAVRQVGDATRKMVRLLPAFQDAQPPKLTPRQLDVYRTLRDIGVASVKELCYFTGTTEAVIQALVKKGIGEYYQDEIYRNPYEAACAAPVPEEIVLSQEQETALDVLKRDYQADEGKVSLLYGVTGSGKTLVFLKLIDQAVRDQKGVIVMVPEISLTPQTIARFHRRYGGQVAVFHSGLSPAERLDEWKRVKRGEAAIVVGTRSAVFAPFERLGLIILDEEQESTYQSESTPRYHARDVAKFRCAYHKALLVLSSATPSMESGYAAQTGRYSLARLPNRYGQAQLPEVMVADMTQEQLQGNFSPFSQVLLEGLEKNLASKQQSILLLNRRGYHTFVSCKACGEVVTCPSCSISMTYHSANHRLMCHYCGYSVPFTSECPHCHEREVRYAGSGTQRAEEQLQECFPEARILRMDTDSTMTRFAYEKKLRQFAQGEFDMMLGTQMVAKGLDFENVTLVGVLSADQALYSDDFRSNERAFDLLTQVVGRSGRGQLAGKAVIQTFTPEHPVLELAARQDYPHFYQQEIQFRKAMLYPPFADIVVVGFVGEKEEKVKAASEAFLYALGQLAGREYPKLPLRVLSPSPALIAKVSNKYRYKLMMKCRNDRMFRQMLSRLLVAFGEKREFSSVTVFVDTG